jgi:hypothetical protein
MTVPALEMRLQEQWRPIPDDRFDQYLLSSFGRVFSVKAGRLIKPFKGWLTVCHDGIPIKCRLADLVCLVFGEAGRLQTMLVEVLKSTSLSESRYTQDVPYNPLVSGCSDDQSAYGSFAVT